MGMYWQQKDSAKDNLEKNAIAVCYGHSIETEIIMQIISNGQQFEKTMLLELHSFIS